MLCARACPWPLVTLPPLTLTRTIVPNEKEPEKLMDLQRPPGSRASALPRMPWLPEENLSNVSGILGDNLDYCLKHECYKKSSPLSTWKLKSGSQPSWWNTTGIHYDGHGRRRKVVGMGEWGLSLEELCDLAKVPPSPPSVLLFLFS